MRATTIAVCVFLAAAPALAGHIGLYADPNGVSCVAPLLPAPTINAIYVIDESGSGTAASKWRISHGIPLLSVSFALTNPYLPIVPIGDPLGPGTTVTYLACRATPYVIGQLGFMYFGGPVEGCDHLQVVAHQGDSWYPAEATAVVVDCANVNQTATGGRFSFASPGTTCACTDPVGIEKKSWGAIKALYR